MNKRYLTGIIVVIFAVIGLGALYAWIDSSSTLPSFSDKEMADKRFEMAAESGQTNVLSPSILVPLDLSQPVRLAIGGLGLADNDQNQQIGDLITAEITGSSGFDLIERQSLGSILRELNLSLHGFVRAKDAVRVGKLLKADWFLLGTEAKINDTSVIVARVVDARTGVLRDAGVFPCDKPPVQLAADLAAFLRQSRQNAAIAKTREYLALGAFEDLSANNRQAGFPVQVRAYLMAAYQGGGITLLEREYVDTLLREVRLDLAGLAEENGTNPPPSMQSAFWLVSGQYQSYETTNLQVELTLKIQRMFGKTKFVTLQDLPGEVLNRQIKSNIDETINQNSGNTIFSRVSESKAQMAAGRDLFRPFLPLGGALGLVYVSSNGDLDPQSAAKKRRNVEEAMHAFQTALLLESTNREAKMYLAACLRDPTVYRLDDARNYYREIIEEPVQDLWSEAAQKALLQTFERGWWGGSTPEEEARWFESAELHAANPSAVEFFRRQAEAARQDIAIDSDVSKAQAMAESKLLLNITNSWLEIVTVGVPCNETAMIENFVTTFGTNQAAAANRLGELYPKLKTQAPALVPYLLAQFVTVQVDTNAPMVSEFKQMVEQYSAHPDQVFMPDKFWWHTWPAYEWSYNHKLYGTAARLLEGKLHAATHYPNHVWGISNEDKLGLAYAYLGAHEWEKALKIFEAYTNQPVQMRNEGPWGKGLTIAFPGKEAGYCRQKLGQAISRSSQEFSMGQPLFCFCVPSTFTADENGLWIGLGGQLLQLDFDLKTNLVVNLPMDSFVPVTALCVTASNIWIGTGGAGLLEFDKATHVVRPATEKNGLMMDSITSLDLTGDTLWIGYGNSSQGGLGKLDLATHQFKSYTPSLAKDPEVLRHTTGNIAVESSDQPTRRQMIAVAGKNGDDAWFATEMHPLRHYQAVSNIWDGFKQIRDVTCLLVNDDKLFAGQRWNDLSQNQTGPLGVSILDLKNGQWRRLKGAEGIVPGEVTTLCLEASNLWVGGVGYIALVDPSNDQMLRYAQIQAKGVNRIQTGGGYVWAQFDWHLYRAPLVDDRPVFLQKNFARFVPVEFQEKTNGEAAIQRFRTRENVFAWKDQFFCGFKFTVPSWLDGNIQLMYLLAKSETEQDFSMGYMVSSLVSESGPPVAAYDYFRESLEDYPRLQKQFPYTKKLTTQNLGRSSFEPGKTYAVCFELDKADLPDIAFALTVNSLRGTNEFGALPLR